MEDWQDELRRKEREQKEDQRARDQDRAENERHREKMALEEKRDRVASMRARGMSEEEIGKSEFKRGCLPVLTLVAIGIGYLIFVAVSRLSADGATSLLNDDQTEEAEMSAPKSVTTEADVALPVSEPSVPPSTESTEIQFVSEPVIQPIPNGADTNDDPSTVESQ